jgi:hypothetical protein
LDVLRVVVGHLGERAADLQAVVEDDDVDGGEGSGGPAGWPLDERTFADAVGLHDLKPAVRRTP